MTNREYLSALDTPDLVNWILFEAAEIGKMSTQSALFLAEWMDSEYGGWITVREISNFIMQQWKSEDTE